VVAQVVNPRLVPLLKRRGFTRAWDMGLNWWRR